jgi:RimJ/RimL family protein N-acetyltransferase
MNLQPSGERIDEIETPRFRLRPLASSDEDLYRGIYCDSDTMRFIGTPLSLTYAKRSFGVALRQTARTNSRIYFLTIEEKAGGDAIGICGIHCGVPASGEAEVGIMLSSRARKAGLSHEAFGAFISHVFASSSVERLWVRYAKGHVAVDRMITRLGFSRDLDQRQEGDSLSWRRAWVRREDLQWEFQSTNQGQAQ